MLFWDHNQSWNVGIGAIIAPISLLRRHLAISFLLSAAESHQTAEWQNIFL